MTNNIITAPMVQIPKEQLKFVLNALNKEQAGDVLLALSDYVINGAVGREMDSLSNASFELIKSSIDLNEEKYVTSVKRANAANEIKAERKNKNKTKTM